MYCSFNIPIRVNPTKSPGAAPKCSRSDARMNSKKFLIAYDIVLCIIIKALLVKLMITFVNIELLQYFEFSKKPTLVVNVVQGEYKLQSLKAR